LKSRDGNHSVEAGKNMDSDSRADFPKPDTAVSFQRTIERNLIL